jgi:predicted acylesterase/phospholipase RssA
LATRAKDGVTKAARRRRPTRRTRSKVALVCAGGGITGAVYEIGCLRAMEDLFDRSMVDLDLYVGISGGAFVNALVAAGFSPRELYHEVTAGVRSPFGVGGAELFRLGLGDLAKRSLRAPGALSRGLATALRAEGGNAYDLLFSLVELLPPGLLDNSGVRDIIARILSVRARPDRFDALARELYIVAVDLDSGEALAFGERGRRDVPVSLAVQASTALPGLYRPVRIAGRDYVDGGVKKTAHINLAIQNGADLVICINPIVPILNDTHHGPLQGHLANRGISYVLDQALRIMLHGRMEYGLERYGQEHPEVDILLIEPTRDDMRMFSFNIMRYSARRVVARYGYRSALSSFRQHHARYKALLARHGIRLRDPFTLDETPERLPDQSALGRHLSTSLDLLDSSLRRI